MSAANRPSHTTDIQTAVTAVMENTHFISHFQLTNFASTIPKPTITKCAFHLFAERIIPLVTTAGVTKGIKLVNVEILGFSVTRTNEPTKVLT